MWPLSVARLAFACLLLVVVDAAVYRPVVVLHGMIDSGTAFRYQHIVEAIKQKYPGIYATSLNVYNDLSSIDTPMELQLQAVIQAIQNDTQLAKGFNFYGESQGALLARAYVTAHNNPPVHNLVALNGPQAGVGECPHIEIPYVQELCGELGTALDIYNWPFCSFCSYWRGKYKEGYLGKSLWLADINNQRTINETRRQNMRSLNKYMATVASQDVVVQPKESAWHTFWHWGSKTDVMSLNETDGYVKDELGLKTLNERGDLILNEFDGPHIHPPWSWWDATVIPMFDNTLPDDELSPSTEVLV